MTSIAKVQSKKVDILSSAESTWKPLRALENLVARHEVLTEASIETWLTDTFHVDESATSALDILHDLPKTPSLLCCIGHAGRLSFCYAARTESWMGLGSSFSGRHSFWHLSIHRTASPGVGRLNACQSLLKLS